MTALVTGASGFLGGRLAQVLAERGEAVRILARPSSALDHLRGHAVDVAYGELEDPASLAAAARGVRTIYHCAALSSDWAPWEQFEAVNVRGVQHLLAAAGQAATVERFVHVSTTDVYGYPTEVCDEAGELRDVGLPYGRSKGLGERAVWDHHGRTGLPVTVARPVNLYGPRSKDFVVEVANLLVQGQMLLINGGDSRAGLLFVDDAVDALIAAARSDHTRGRAYNLRSPTDESWRDYVGALARGLGVKLPWLNLPASVAHAAGRAFEGLYRTFRIGSRPLLTRHAVRLMSRDQGFPIARAQRDFDFRCRVSFEEGVRRTVAWLETPEGYALVPRPVPAADEAPTVRPRALVEED